MELLPRDIKAIIHRYIFDSYYSRVKVEYERIWQSYWDDDEQCFADADSYRANWRHFLNGICQGSVIYKFGSSYDIATMPIKY